LPALIDSRRSEKPRKASFFDLENTLRPRRNPGSFVSNASHSPQFFFKFRLCAFINPV